MILEYTSSAVLFIIDAHEYPGVFGFYRTRASPRGRVCLLASPLPLLKRVIAVCSVAMIELHELEESQVSVESVRGWCVEEQAMEMDIAVLQQVEELERKVTAASLQVKVEPQPSSSS